MPKKTKDTAQPQRRTEGAATKQVRTTDEGEIAIPVVEEELQIGKRRVEGGGVRVKSRVEETPVEQDINLREEHVRVERRPVNRAVGEADLDAFEEGTIELTESAEVAVVGKRARVVEEVVVGKEARERTETVRDTLHRTDVEVEKIEPGRPRKR